MSEAEARKGAEMDECLIPKTAVIEGNLSAEGKVVINGRFVGGKISVKGSVYVGAEALVTGEIESDEIIVGGCFEGSLVARDRLEVESMGQVSGEIKAKRLLINDGAKFEGTCHMAEGGKPSAVKTRNSLPAASATTPVTVKPEINNAPAKKIIVTIDGPAGAGKTTIARRLSKELKYTYLDTGAMYRALTWKAIEHKLDLEDETALVEMAANTEIRLAPKDDMTRVFCDGKDVSEEIRKPYISKGTSFIADVPGVREILVALQRQMAENGGVVLEGRDTGTVVVPDAEKKFYLDASLEERTLRRANELEASGMEVDLNQLMDEIRKRDERDRSRPVGTLKKAEGAISIDTTKMNIDDVIKVTLKYINQG